MARPQSTICQWTSLEKASSSSSSMLGRGGLVAGPAESGHEALPDDTVHQELHDEVLSETSLSLAASSSSSVALVLADEEEQAMVLSPSGLKGIQSGLPIGPILRRHAVSWSAPPLISAS